MKPFFLQISIFIFTLFTFNLTAQIIIDKDNFPREMMWTDSGQVSLATDILLPSHGANQIWDYSSLSSDISFEVEYLDGSMNPNFPDGHTSIVANSGFSVGPLDYTIPTRTYEAIDENGWYRTGRSYEETTVSLAALTGGADDQLFYPTNDAVFSGRLDFVKFPMTFEDQWTESYNFDLLFELTAAAFGIDQAPAFTRVYYTNEREIVGHGTLILPKPDGTATNPMDVLLVKVDYSQVDSMFLGGAPASQALLDAFGIEQGAMTSGSAYNFYKADFGTVVMIVDVSDDGTAEKATYRYHAEDIGTAIQNYDIPKMHGFPNPITSGSVFTIPLEDNVTSGSIRFTDFQGRSVLHLNFKAVSNNPLKIEFPTHLKGNMLMYTIFDESNNPIGVGKVHVF